MPLAAHSGPVVAARFQRAGPARHVGNVPPQPYDRSSVPGAWSRTRRCRKAQEKATAYLIIPTTDRRTRRTTVGGTFWDGPADAGWLPDPAGRRFPSTSGRCHRDDRSASTHADARPPLASATGPRVPASHDSAAPGRDGAAAGPAGDMDMVGHEAKGEQADVHAGSLHRCVIALTPAALHCMHCTQCMQRAATMQRPRACNDPQGKNQGKGKPLVIRPEQRRWLGGPLPGPTAWPQAGRPPQTPGRSHLPGRFPVAG